MRSKVPAAITMMAIAFSLMVAAENPALAQSSSPKSSPPKISPGKPLETWQKVPVAPEEKGEIKTYLHPVRKFTLAIPPGAEVAERGKGPQVSIRSPKGFMINIQTGDANPKLTLPQMAAKLEALYLGAGRPWSQKVLARPTTVAGLESLETQYSGAGTRIKVVITRGLKTDFIFMFFAPKNTFDDMSREFEWTLVNFRPNPADHPATARIGAPGGKVMAKASLKPNRFAEQGYG